MEPRVNVVDQMVVDVVVPIEDISRTGNGRGIGLARIVALCNKTSRRRKGVAPEHETVLIAVLVIEATEVFVVEDDHGMGEQTSSRRRNVWVYRGGVGVMLAFIGGEVPEFVPLDRSADCATILFVRKRENRLSNRIGRVEEGVTEVAKRSAMQGVGAGLGLDVHVDSG